jgi:class 3 adenylate cyclase
MAAPRDAPSPADAERRQLTVMFFDLVGSTELSSGRYETFARAGAAPAAGDPAALPLGPT